MRTLNTNGPAALHDSAWHDAGRRAAHDMSRSTTVNHDPPDAVHQEIHAQHETAKEWGERQARETRRVRGISGVVIGIVVGIFLIDTRVGFSMPWYVVMLIMAGCILFCYAHFSGDGEDKSHFLAWFVWPEWMLFHLLPLWSLFAIFAALVLGIVALWAGYMTGMFN